MSFEIQQFKELTQVESVQDISLGIMKWGRDNSFPQTLVNLIEQSPNAKPAVKRAAKFYRGGDFEGEDLIVSPTGLTLKHLVSAIADDYSVFEAFAVHCNYNLKGEVTSMVPIRVAELRFNEFDELNTASKLGYHPNFGNNAVEKKTVANTVTKGKIKWLNRFNPEATTTQIEKTEGGISNYLGQILYFSENGMSRYPIPPLQAPINFVLSDIENSILVRKETATGFINTFLLKTMLDEGDSNLVALENAIADAQGARGSGKVITMSGLSAEELENTTLEELTAGTGSSGSVIENCTKTYDLDKLVITGAYLIPPALAGIDQKTGFSSADLKEAYFIFNAVTKPGRDSIESEINRILKNSIFSVKEIKLNKLALEIEEGELEEKTVNTLSPKALAKKAKKKKRLNAIMGGPGSGRTPYGKKGEEDSKSLGSVKDDDYKRVASQDDKYESYYNGTAEEKTLEAYTNRGFQVNYSIRDGDANKTDQQYIDNLNTSLSNLPTDTGNTLYRGINIPSSEFNSIEPGSELNFKGFTSTTKNREKAEKFKLKNTSENDTPTVFVINSHKNGKDVSLYSSIKSEQEVLFKSNTLWEVVSVSGNEVTIKEK